jgi:hypothetical protein
MDHQNPNPTENGSRDIAVFVLVMLAALALLSFVWAGLRIREIRAGASIETSLPSPPPPPFRYGQALARNWR